MRSRKFFTEGESLNFDISISDLMSALCGIFALVMITIVVQLNMEKAEYTSKNAKAENYYSMQQELYQDLLEEFENDLEKWNAEITKDYEPKYDLTNPFTTAIYNARNIITRAFSNVREDEKIDKSRYYAEAIISKYNWNDIGILEFKTAERNELIKRLQERYCVEIYNRLKEK